MATATFPLDVADATILDQVVSQWLDARAQELIEETDDGTVLEGAHDLALRLGQWLGRQRDGQ